MAITDPPAGCLLHGIPFGQRCCWCQPRIGDAAIPAGWQCPVCLHILGPQVAECPHCPGARFPLNLPPASPSPVHQARCAHWTGGDCDCAFRGSRWTPAAPAGETPTLGGFGAESEHDPPPGCGCLDSGEHAAHAALKARPPGPASPSLSLPAEMGGPHYNRIARIGQEWAEVFPGLQACAPGLGDSTVTARFRLTPPGGGRGD